MSAAHSSLFESVLARCFLRTLRWAAAGGALWGGCEGGQFAEPSAPVPGLDPVTYSGGRPAFTCRDGSWRPLTGFGPVESWDYVSLRSRTGASPAHEVVLQELGQVCPDAAPADQCLTQVDAALAQIDDATGLFLLATRGSEVRVFRGAEALTFFGQVDRADEAMWLLSVRQPGLNPCSPEQLATVELDSEGGYRISASVPQAGALCEFGGGRAVGHFVFVVRPDGGIEGGTESASSLPLGCPIPGRRPDGLCREPRRAAHEPLGALLAREAHAEAASVWAFDTLARELHAHAAPAALWRGARRARHEEARHAREMARLAQRYGGEPRLPWVERQPLRSLSELTRDNAVEGCVRETYAALRVAYQAQRARDPACARVMALLARDELRHASWSWQLAHWAEPRLSVSARRQVREARRQALHELENETRDAPALEAQWRAGYPSASAAQVLVAGVRAAAAVLST